MNMNEDQYKQCKVFSELAECILVGGAYKATRYLSDKLTIKATRKRIKGKIDKRSRIIEIVFTVGAPNYQERKAIKKAKKAKETLDTTVLIPAKGGR